jgi:hypothetical protein
MTFVNPSYQSILRLNCAWNPFEDSVGTIFRMKLVCFLNFDDASAKLLAWTGLITAKVTRDGRVTWRRHIHDKLMQVTLYLLFHPWLLVIILLLRYNAIKTKLVADISMLLISWSFLLYYEAPKQWLPGSLAMREISLDTQHCSSICLPTVSMLGRVCPCKFFVTHHLVQEVLYVVFVSTADVSEAL